MSPKSTYHHGDLKAALIAAGADVLKAEGLEALTLRRAAREAEVSAAAPYRHFKDKKALLAAIAENGFRELHRLLEAKKKKRPGDLDAGGQAYLAFAQKEPATYRLMFTQNMLCEGEPEPSLKEAAEAAFHSLVETIEIGRANGLIAAEDSASLALASWSLMHGVALLLIDGILEDGPYGKLSPAKVLSLCQSHFKAGWGAGK